MAEEGFAYIPDTCKNKAGCKVFVSLHGCGQGGNNTPSYSMKSRLAHYAATNNLILLFPQAERQDKDLSYGMNNQGGCWDDFGYTGPDYATNKGLQ